MLRHRKAFPDLWGEGAGEIRGGSGAGSGKFACRVEIGYAFAKRLVSENAQGLEDIGAGLWSNNDFEQAHITRWVKEMGNGKVFAESFWKIFCQLFKEDSGCV